MKPKTVYRHGKNDQIILLAMLILSLTGCAFIHSGNEQSIEAEDEYTEQISSGEEIEDMTPTASVLLVAGEHFFTINLEDNTSAEAFFEKINHEPLKIEMHDYGNFEKVGDLPWELPTNDEEITTSPGDVILYQGNKITIYYDENTWNFTKLGEINGTPEEIREAFGGEDDITAEFSVEWTE